MRDRAARQLRAADPCREPEIVLDSSRRARLSAERGALDDERLQTLGRPIDRRAEACGAAADDDEIDLFSGCELASDPERAGDLAGRGAAKLKATRQAHERQLGGIEPFDQGGCRRVPRLLRVAPG